LRKANRKRPSNSEEHDFLADEEEVKTDKQQSHEAYKVPRDPKRAAIKLYMLIEIRRPLVKLRCVMFSLVLQNS
jgi:hypothetical protein